MRTSLPTPVTTLVLLALLVPSACGHDKPSGDAKATRAAGSSPAVDRSTPEVVLAQAHRALAAGDLDGMRPFLTDEGVRRLSRDLAAWRALLVDPVGGPRIAPRVKLPEDAAGREIAKRALQSDDPGPLLRVYVASEPRLPLPPLAPLVREPATDRAELTMPARDGETRLVRFVRGPDGWRIDRIEL